MLGLHCVGSNLAMQELLADSGLLTVAAGENVLRLVPPLVVTDEECDAALAMIESAVAPQVTRRAS